MSLPTVYLQHRMQLLERHFSTLVQMMKLRHPGDADDLERVSQTEVEEKHAALLSDDRAYFDQREQEVSKRRGA